MARKKICIKYTSPITMFFCLLCLAIFILNSTIDTDIIKSIFMIGGNASSNTPFDRFSFIDYISIFTHIFGHTSWSMLALNLTFILLLGPQIEESYGKGLFVLMFCLTAFITGVLSTLFVSTHIEGAQGVVLLLIVLSILSYAKAKIIPITIVFSVIIYITSVFFISPATSLSEKIVPCIGALSASIFGFIDFMEQMKPTPRKRKQQIT